MTQGIFIHGSRPKSKRHVKAVVERAQMTPEAQQSLIDSDRADARIMGGAGKDDWMHTHVHDLFCIVVEATSIFGDEFDGSLHIAQDKEEVRGKGITFVGPDPYTKRSFYGNIKWKPDPNNSRGGKWIVT